MTSGNTILKQNFSTINNNTIGIQNNFINRTKILSGLSPYTYSSRTVDRKDIKDSNSFNKIEGILNLNNLNNSKDDIIINTDTNVNVNNTEKIKVNINNDRIMSQIKKETLIQQVPQPQVNKEDKTIQDTNTNTNNNNNNKENNDEKNDNKNENNDNNNNNNNNNNITSDIQEFINKNKEEDKNSINFLKEYKEILDKFGNNLNPSDNK